MTNNLRTVIEQNNIKIGPIQQDILKDLIGSDGDVVCWSSGLDIKGAATVILDEAPRGFQIDGLCRSLSADATVIIPYSENPQFDFIKSRLSCHGTIGASAPEAPHQIWWGGLLPAKAEDGMVALRHAHIVSCVRRQTHEERDALNFSKALADLGISYSIDLSEPDVYCDDRSVLRSEALLRAWETGNKPLIWLDPMGASDLSTLNPTFAGADFAAIYEPGEGFSTALLYFGRSRAAHELLMHWNKLCAEFPDLPADFILDTAWAMISAQRMLVTRWLSAEACQSVIVGARAAPVAPSRVVREPLTCRTPSMSRARRAGRIGAPEPQCIMTGNFSGGAPITFVTSSEAAPARDVAILMEDVIGAFSRYDGGFSSLAIVVCQDVNEAAETIKTAGDGWVLYCWPNTAIQRQLFNLLGQHKAANKVTYLGSQTRERTHAASGRSFAVTKSQIVFGRGHHFFAVDMQRKPAPLQLVV